jgi:hypothetical protein
VTNANLPSNIPNPDPSVVANERLAEALKLVYQRINDIREEVKYWVESLQKLLEEQISRTGDATASLDRVVQTRLAGSETALNAAMAAADKVTQKIELNFGNVLVEMKGGMTKQIDTIKESMDEIKGRLDRGEGVLRSSADDVATRRAERSDSHGSNQNFIAMVAAGIGAAGVLIALGGIMYTATRPTPLAPAVVYAQPGGVDPPRLQHQSFPLVPTWDNIYRIVQ